MSSGYTGELFGRDKILNYLSKRFDTAMTGKGCIDLLYGDAGIGKTAIINKFISMHQKFRVYMFNALLLQMLMIYINPVQIY